MNDRYPYDECLPLTVSVEEMSYKYKAQTIKKVKHAPGKGYWVYGDEVIYPEGNRPGCMIVGPESDIPYVIPILVDTICKNTFEKDITGKYLYERDYVYDAKSLDRPLEYEVCLFRVNCEGLEYNEPQIKPTQKLEGYDAIVLSLRKVIWEGEMELYKYFHKGNYYDRMRNKILLQYGLGGK